MNYLSQKWVFVALLTAFMAIDCTAYFPSCFDTIPPEKQEYKGYRLHLTALKVLRQKGEEVKIQYTLINTGRENIALGGKAAAMDKLLVLFDQSLQTAKISQYQQQIRNSLLQQQLSIVAGQIKRNNELSFSTKAIPNTSEEKVKVEEVVAIEPENLEKKEELLDAAEPENSTKEVVEKIPVKEEEKSDTPEKEEDYTPYLDRDNCSDLVIEHIKIVKQGKRNVTLEYSLVNQGNGPAYLFGSTKSKEDNVAIRANISGSTRLSRGAIIIGGGYITEGLKKENGKLMPNERYIGTIKLDTYKMTKFTPNIILELDAYNSLIECDETNNRSHIRVD